MKPQDKKKNKISTPGRYPEVKRTPKMKTSVESAWCDIPRIGAQDGFTFSVIMPAYNAAEYITRAMDSVINQTTPLAIELIVIDDCSTDNTYEIVEDYARKQPPNAKRVITLMRNSKNYGVAYSRNAGIAQAKGDYVAFLDSDDWWKEEKLEQQFEYLKRKCAAILDAKRKAEDVGKKVEAKLPVLCCTGRELTTEDGVPLGRIIGVPQTITYNMLLKNNYITCSSVILKRRIALKYPMKRDDLHEDYITWLKILKRYGPAIGFNRPLVNSRMTENGKSRNKVSAAIKRFKCYRVLGINPFKALWYFANYALEGYQKYNGL